MLSKEIDLGREVRAAEDDFISAQSPAIEEMGSDGSKKGCFKAASAVSRAAGSHFKRAEMKLRISIDGDPPKATDRSAGGQGVKDTLE